MKNINYSLLRGQIILFISVLVLCLVFIILSFSYHSKQQSTLMFTQLDLDTTSQEVNHLNNLISLFEHFNTDYKYYAAKGFLEKEQRLEWIESLEDTAKRLGLNGLRYQIEARNTAFDPSITPSPGVNLFVSKLTLDIGLMHEGDLVEVLNNLGRVNSGLLVVDNCKIERTSLTPELASSRNFQANCSLLWYTAKFDDQQGRFVETPL